MSSLKMEVFDLLEYAGKQDNWVIGSPIKVPVDSPGYSKSLQISYHYKEIDHREEKFHYHTDGIEECYFVFEGSITLRIDKKDYRLSENQAIRVPPLKPHKIINFSDPVTYVTIRAPPSNDNTTVKLE